MHLYYLDTASISSYIMIYNRTVYSCLQFTGSYRVLSGHPPEIPVPSHETPKPGVFQLF